MNLAEPQVYKPANPRYYDRDLSWLSFNYRVLMEAKDKSLPLYERIKFLAIYSSNLDEFFRVRVASLRSVLSLKKKKRTRLGFDAQEVLDQVHREVNQQLEEFGNIFQNEILPELRENHIDLVLGAPEADVHKAFVEQFFEEEVSPYLHVELLRRKRIRHFLRDNALYLAVKLYSRSPRALKDAADSGNEEKRARRAIILIPTHYFPRFIELPQIGDNHYIMFLDDVIRYNLKKLFPGYELIASHSIKLTRDADLQIEDEFSGDLVEKIRKSLNKRKIGVPARFLYDQRAPKNLLRYLRDTFNLSEEDLLPGGVYHHFVDFFSFPNPFSPDLERDPTPPQPLAELDAFPTMVEAIRARNWILHFPYQSYDYFIRFLNQAAIDPDVVTIRTTQYRVASNSAIVNALVRAAQMGKDVTVFVELKARFDEAHNLGSAKQMEAAGVNIIYSIPGLKVHAKVALVSRKEGDTVHRYAFMSTGNFNEKTAMIYADHGYFTAEEGITKELHELFQHLNDRSYKPPPFKKLLVAQFNMRHAFYRMIQREIDHVKAGRKGEILIKLNNLEDKHMIDRLYTASQAGVKITLIVRSICCLRPGVPGLSENIRIIRIVDQFLEHARVFVFHNNGADDLYMGSADWMKRNLSHRIEVIFPVKEPELKAEVLAILHLQLADNVKAVHLNENIENIPIEVAEEAPRVRMQTEVYRRIKTGTLLPD